MKRLTTLISAGLMLVMLCACSNTRSIEVPHTSLPANTEKPAPEVNTVSKMTSAADALGITAENYPRIDGSTSTLSIAQAVYCAMYGGDAAYTDEYPTKASKTVPSYKLLIDGKADMILVPYASADVLEEAENSGVELEFYKVASEALIFITSVENPTQSITLEQIREIYLNYGIANWSELGGPDRELVPICRNSDSGSQSQMDNLILNNEEMHPDIHNNYVELTMEGMLEQVAFYHNGGLSGTPTDSYALGYTLYTYLQGVSEITGIGDYLKILSFDGVLPAAENIADGYYPLADGYYAVIRSDLSENHSARSVIKWLQSKDGAQAIENIGLIAAETVPLTAEELEIYNKTFEYMLSDEQGSPAIYLNPINVFLTSYYNRPQDINLSKLLQYFPADDLVTDKTEFEALKAAEHWPFVNFETLDSMPVPIRKIYADTLNKALQKHMGITLDDLSGEGTDNLIYLEEYDAYYNFTSDAGSAFFACVSGETQGDIIRLYSENATLALKLRDDGFWIVSHQPAGKGTDEN